MGLARDRFVWPKPLRRAFRLLAFDWDGTAVESRHVDATPVRRELIRLLDRGVWIVVVSGTNVDNVHRQCSAAIPPASRKRLILGLNRGSEVFGFDANELVIRSKRLATADQERRLTEIAECIRDELHVCTGLEFGLVLDRLNRRKIDLIPEPEWSDPPKAHIVALARATDARLRLAGLDGGLRAAIKIAQHILTDRGLSDWRITTDAKYLEVGLTDKGDTMRWVWAHLLLSEHISVNEICIAGDEFGGAGGISGSDARMMIPQLKDAVAMSVGDEPFGGGNEVVEDVQIGRAHV